MFGFNKKYVPLGVETARTQSDGWARAEGDADPADSIEKGPDSSSSSQRFATPATAGMGADSGRVQVPIGMVSNSQQTRSLQFVALGIFMAVNIAVFIVIFAGGLATTGFVRTAIIVFLGGGWVVLLLYNVRTAGKPRRVLQNFLHNKQKTKLGRRIGRGQVVVIKGAVSLLTEELLSTEFHNVPGLVLVESSLRSYHQGLKKSDAWTEHVRQTRAVDFRVTDASTGMSAIVRAYNAAEAGAATPLVHISTEVPLSTVAPVAAPATPAGGDNLSAPRPVETEETRRRRQAANPQLMVCKGYIRQGQVVTVMGTLHEEPGTHELLIEPLTKPHNVAKLLLMRGFIPFFFPTWASGLVISDQRDFA